MDLGKEVDLLVSFVQEVLQLSNLGLQSPDPLFKRFGISSRESSSTELVAGLALEADVLALGAAGGDAIAANLLAAASIARLSDSALRVRSNLDDLHW